MICIIIRVFIILIGKYMNLSYLLFLVYHYFDTYYVIIKKSLLKEIAIKIILVLFQSADSICFKTLYRF